MPFNKEYYDESIQWAEDTLKLIEAEKEWLPNNSSSYYCNYLCGQRNNACEYKIKLYSNKNDVNNKYYNPEEDKFEEV